MTELKVKIWTIYYIIGVLITLYAFWKNDKTSYHKMGFTMSLFISVIFGFISGAGIVIFTTFKYMEKKWN